MLKIITYEPAFPMDAIIGIETASRARKDLGETAPLMSDIERRGLINPITIEHKTNRLLAGGRRHHACWRLNWKTIPALIVECDGPIDLIEIELMENRHRKDMLWHEEAVLDKRIHEHYMSSENNWDQKQSSRILSISPAEMTRRLQLAEYLDLVPELKNYENATQAVNAIQKIVKDKTVERTSSEFLAAQDSPAPQDESSPKTPVTTGNRTLSEVFPPYGTDILKCFKTDDALKGMKRRKEGSFHGAEVDPPYGIDLKSKRVMSQDQHAISRYNEVDADEYEAFLKSTAEQVYRLLADDAFVIWWFGIEWYQQVRSTLLDVGFAVPVVPGIWIKYKGQTNSPQTNLANVYESFFLARKGKPVLQKMGTANAFVAAGVPPSQRTHPTERPQQLMRDLLQTVFAPHTRLLVPFLGSGVTLFTAYKLQMWGTGWDLDKTNKDHFLARVKGEVDGNK